MSAIICTEAISLNENGNWTDHRAGRDYALKCLAKHSAKRLFLEAVVYTALAEGARQTILAGDSPARWIQFTAAGCHIGAWIFAVIAALALSRIVAPIFVEICEVVRGPAPTPLGGASEVAKVASTSTSADASNRPPAAAVFLLDLVLPIRERLTILGDLEEAYTNDLLPQHGRTKARLWYWFRASRELMFCCWPVVKRLLPWTVLIAMAHHKSEWIAEAIRRLSQS